MTRREKGIGKREKEMLLPRTIVTPLGSPSTHRRPRKRAAGSAGCILWMLTRAGRACPLGNSATAVQGSWLRRRSRLRGHSPIHTVQRDIPERERPLSPCGAAPLEGEPRLPRLSHWIDSLRVSHYSFSLFPYPFSLGVSPPNSNLSLHPPPIIDCFVFRHARIDKKSPLRYTSIRSNRKGGCNHE